MHTFTIILPGTIRSKKNSKRIFKRGKGKKAIVLTSESYTAWQDECRKLVRRELAQYDYVLPLAGRIEVRALCFCKGNLPDLSGALESVGDCMEGVLWANDKLIESWDGSRVYHELQNPRTEVTVRWED